MRSSNIALLVSFSFRYYQRGERINQLLSFNSCVVGENQEGENKIIVARFKGGFLNTKRQKNSNTGQIVLPACLQKNSTCERYMALGIPFEQRCFLAAYSSTPNTSSHRLWKNVFVLLASVTNRCTNLGKWMNLISCKVEHWGIFWSNVHRSHFVRQPSWRDNDSYGLKLMDFILIF